jgi:hypothetical protein
MPTARHVAKPAAPISIIITLRNAISRFSNAEGTDDKALMMNPAANNCTIGPILD